MFEISIFLVEWNEAIIQHGFDCVLFYGNLCHHHMHDDAQFGPLIIIIVINIVVVIIIIIRHKYLLLFHSAHM